ncbi:hypothetical protein [Streptosporangium sp. NPDC003464]
MPSDPDHVLDAIDGVVDEWLAMSEDSMRWAPPEKAPPRRQLALPAPPLPGVSAEFMHDVGIVFGAQAQAVVEAVTEVFRPLGEGLAGALAAVLDSPAVRQLVELVDPPEERASPDPVEGGEHRDGPSPAPPSPDGYP